MFAKNNYFRYKRLQFFFAAGVYISILHLCIAADSYGLIYRIPAGNLVLLLQRSFINYSSFTKHCFLLQSIYIFYLHHMKIIGFIGGLTWLSSMDYYRLLNQLTNQKLGGVSSCKMLMYSVDFEEIKTLTVAGDWEGIASIICKVAQTLEQAGADCILIGANTMHYIADKVQASINIPLIHIAEVTATAIATKGFNKVALLGTKYTMQLDFYKNKLDAKNIQTIIPNPAAIEYINDAIYNEMGKGIFLPERKERFIQIIQSLQQQGAQGVILGCTEIPLLIKQADVTIPVFDTTVIHVQAAITFALQ